MSRRGGFTLIELMVTITLAGIVALLVYGAASAAIETERRVRVRDAAGRAELAWRAVVEDALRNLRTAEQYGRPTFELESATDALGRPADRLRFVTTGGVPPLTPEADWDVTLESTADGLVMTAVPIGVDAPPRRVPAPPGVTGLDVHVVVAADQGRLDRWPGYPFLPRAVAITYWRDGAPSGPSTLLTIPQGLRR